MGTPCLLKSDGIALLVNMSQDFFQEDAIAARLSFGRPVWRSEKMSVFYEG